MGTVRMHASSLAKRHYIKQWGIIEIRRAGVKRTPTITKENKA
jgi:hypothetical protein